MGLSLEFEQPHSDEVAQTSVGNHQHMINMPENTKCLNIENHTSVWAWCRCTQIGDCQRKQNLDVETNLYFLVYIDPQIVGNPLTLHPQNDAD